MQIIIEKGVREGDYGQADGKEEDMVQIDIGEVLIFASDSSLVRCDSHDLHNQGAYNMVLFASC